MSSMELGLIREQILSGLNAPTIALNNRMSEELLAEHGASLSDFFHLMDCNSLKTISGKNILEIGGNMSREFVNGLFRPKSWTSIGCFANGEAYDERYSLFGPSLETISSTDVHCNYGFRGFIRYVLPLLNLSQFDIVYSVAAFEHIHRLGDCIDLISEIICPEGFLYSYFTVCWFGPNGHHWGNQRSQIGPYDHLAYSESEMRNFLFEQGESAEDADLHSYYIYRDSRINRNTHTDYIRYFRRGSFKSRNIQLIGAHPVRDLKGDLAKRIISRYPQEETLCTGYRIAFAK